ncbi:interleukin 15, like isoform X2 [Mugil cephalus]|uniref:interleukin 15, like isoform X2 n=1 Tax=Mugil cephalus TaxID=48193 RepID=UPI001FB5FD61|nr:interleukin 15, like isoform X2 [Mugil cephalus]
MLRGRSALVGVFLCYVCLLVAEPEIRSPRCSEDIIRRLRALINGAPEKNWLACRLYTPTFPDYEKCPSTTLKCFADEVKVLCEEWEVSNRKSRRNLNTMLQKLASAFNQTETDCRQCELLEEQSAEKFLNALLSTIEAINEKYCVELTANS